MDGEDGRTLSAWRRFAGHVSRFGEFYLIDPPFDLICSEKKNATFLTIFHSFPKSMFWPCFTLCSVNNRLRPGFRHCSRITPVFLCPRLVSKRQDWQCLLNKPKPVQNVSVYPVFCVQWLLTTVINDLSFRLVVLFRSPGSIPMRFLRKNCGDFPYF